ncbi:MAG: hypothetical protein ACI81P_003298, partial [Neolewinella sp.]
GALRSSELRSNFVDRNLRASERLVLALDSRL